MNESKALATLIWLLQHETDVNKKAIILQSYVQQFGAIPNWLKEGIEMLMRYNEKEKR